MPTIKKYINFGGATAGNPVPCQDSAPTAATSATGWTVAKLAASQGSYMDAAVKKTTFADGGTPSTGNDNHAASFAISGLGSGNTRRIAFGPTGGGVTIGAEVVATSGGDQDGELRSIFGYYTASTGAISLAPATLTPLTVTNLTTTPVSGSATMGAPASNTVSGAYEFADTNTFWASLLWWITGAGGNNARDVLLRSGANAYIELKLVDGYVLDFNDPTQEPHTPAMGVVKSYISRSISANDHLLSATMACSSSQLFQFPGSWKATDTASASSVTSAMTTAAGPDEWMTGDFTGYTAGTYDMTFDRLSKLGKMGNFPESGTFTSGVGGYGFIPSDEAYGQWFRIDATPGANPNFDTPPANINLRIKVAYFDVSSPSTQGINLQVMVTDNAFQYTVVTQNAITMASLDSNSCLSVNFPMTGLNGIKRIEIYYTRYNSFTGESYYCGIVDVKATAGNIAIDANLYSASSVVASLQIGNQFSAAALACSSSVSVATIMVGAGLDALAQAAASLSATLRTYSRIPALLQAASTVMSVLTTKIEAAASVSATSAVDAEMTTGIVLGSGLVSTSSVSADLLTVIALESLFAVSASFSALDFNSQIKIAAIIASAASASPEMSSQIVLSADLSASAQMSGLMQTKGARRVSVSTGAEVVSMQTQEYRVRGA